ncbi:MAG: cadherin-like domain-containing protein, partial [Pseudomonadales bacterium]|nr:cadherin-like domain-containing protein [Pseudomonadales bacterium]
ELPSLNIDPFAGTLSSNVFTPDEVGEYPVLLRASDRFDGHSEPVFLLDIKSDRPEIDPRSGFEDQIVRAGEEFRFEIPYTSSIRYQGLEGSVHIGINFDPSWWDGGIPRYSPNGWAMEYFLTSWQNPDDLPAWLNFDTETHTLYGTPTANDSGQNFTIDILLSNHETFGYRHTVRIGVDELVYPPITASSIPDHSMWDGQGFISVAQGSTHSTNTSTILESYKSSPNKQVTILGVRCLKNGIVIYDKQSGGISFTPSDNFTGVTSLTYTMWDGEHISEVNQGVIVLSPSEAITANDDDFGVPVDSQILIPFADLLENDVDAEGDTLRIVALGNVTNGQANLNMMTEMVTFTPDEGYTGEATLEYFVSGGSDITMGTANITVGSTVNTPPTVVDDSLESTANSVLVINVASLLANDSDAEGDNLSISNVLNAVNGEVVLDAQSGEIIFTPDENYVGQASFEYEVSDGTNASTGVVNIEVTSSVGEVIDGTNGADTIIGTTGNDVITGGAGTDTIEGLAGDDTFIYNGIVDGFDHLNGGEGFDRLVATSDDDDIGIHSLQDVEQIDGGGGTNRILMTYWGNVLDFSEVELINIAEIVGSNNHDTITGTDFDDVFIGGAGQDTLNGGGGNDTFIYNGIDDSYDHLRGGEGFDRLVATSDDDDIGIHSLQDVEQIDGGGGTNRILMTYWGNVLDLSEVELVNIAEIVGSNNYDTITGTNFDDVIRGAAGDDTLRSGAGNDTFIFNQGDGYDRFDGGAGDDLILGSTDDDQIGIYSLTNVERIDGGTGYNSLKLHNWAVDHTLDVSQIALQNIDELIGGVYDDTIIGTAGNDRINGGVGDDVLRGGEGNDTFLVKQGDGSDHFDGGTGDDVILGSGGDDQIGIRSLTDIETIDGGAGYNSLKLHNWAVNRTLDVSQIELQNIDELIGSVYDDTIIGSAGDDRINGGLSNDILSGGEGDDTYKFAFGDGRDHINNYSENGIAETDTLLFEGLDYDSLWFSESGDNLIIDSLDSNDRVIIDDWFSSPEFELDEIRVDTHLLLSSQVGQLVQAMASISAGEPVSFENLTAQQQQDYSTAIAAAWQ